jgi:hypothetical protein
MPRIKVFRPTDHHGILTVKDGSELIFEGCAVPKPQHARVRETFKHRHGKRGYEDRERFRHAMLVASRTEAIVADFRDVSIYPSRSESEVVWSDRLVVIAQRKTPLSGHFS